MKKRKIQLIVAAWMISGTGAVYGQSPQPMNVITTAVPFLRVSTDARASGMGDVGLATDADGNSASWNMGKMPFNERKGAVAINYSPWMREISSDMWLASISGYYKTDSFQTISGSFRYFSLGDVQFADDNGTRLQTFHPREWAMDLGYSRKLSDRSGIGLAFRYIHSGLSNKGASGNDYETGSAVAVDLGYYYTAANSAGNGWSFGGALSNLGSKIGYSNNTGEKDFIPANLGLGAAYTRVFDEQNKIQFGLDINKLLVPTPPANTDSAAMVAYRNKSVAGSWFSSFGDAPGGFSEELKEFQVSVGAEYWYNDLFALRAGYAWEDKTKGNRKCFTMGAGIRYTIFNLNFSYLVPAGNGLDRNSLSNTLRFSLVLESKP